MAGGNACSMQAEGLVSPSSTTVAVMRMAAKEASETTDNGQQSALHV